MSGFDEINSLILGNKSPKDQKEGPDFGGLKVNSPVGMRKDPISGQSAYHAGHDLQATGPVTPSLSPEFNKDIGGVVSQVIPVDKSGGYGNTVIVQRPDGSLVRYAHLANLQVKPNQKIDEKTIYGEVGNTGKSTGKHLHYEVMSGPKTDEINSLISGNVNTPEQQKVVEQNNTQQDKKGSFWQEFKKPLAEMSVEDWKKNSLTYPLSQVLNPVNAITSPFKTIETQAELLGKGVDLAKGAYNFLSQTPLEAAQQVKQIGQTIAQNPGAAAGEFVKGSVYDAPLAFIPVGSAKNVIGGLKTAEKIAPIAENLGARSVGAAEANFPVRIEEAINRASPEKQALLKQIPKENWTEKDLATLDVHNKFDKFGMTPTEGQALQDTSKMSDEFNRRRTDPNLQARFEERDPKLIEGFNTLKEKVSPDVFETDPARLASMPLDKINNIYSQKEQNVSNLWKQANMASGTAQAPINVGALRENIINGLKEKQRERYVPEALKADLDEVLQKGYMTPGEYENFRSDTATIARKNPDPMARQAAAIIREKLEQVPLLDEFAQYKPLYDQARKATADLHNFEKSSLVKAAISDTRTPEEIAAGFPHPAAKNFLAKHYSAQTPQVEIERMLDLIGRDSPEHQAINKLKIDEFKLNSGIVNDKGTVSQNALNKQVYEQHKTNLPSMFGQELSRDLQDLADVANLSEPRKGVHAVNTSNTEVLRQQNLANENAKNVAKDITMGIAEQYVNAKTLGLGSIGRAFLKGKSEEKALLKERIAKQLESENTLSPTAGLGKTKLKDIGK